MLQTQKHRQIGRLSDPNPMEDVPDQDLAPNPETKSKLDFAHPSHPGCKGRQALRRVWHDWPHEGDVSGQGQVLLPERALLPEPVLLQERVLLREGE